MNGTVLGFFGLVALSVAGCSGTAMMLGHTAEGGTLTLDGDREDAMADARRQMSDTCGGAYTIVSETPIPGPAGQAPRHELKYVCGAHPEKQISRTN